MPSLGLPHKELNSTWGWIIEVNHLGRILSGEKPHCWLKDLMSDRLVFREFQALRLFMFREVKEEIESGLGNALLSDRNQKYPKSFPGDGLDIESWARAQNSRRTTHHLVYRHCRSPAQIWDTGVGRTATDHSKKHPYPGLSGPKKIKICRPLIPGSFGTCRGDSLVKLTPCRLEYSRRQRRTQIRL